jgi:hypothetical protein
MVGIILTFSNFKRKAMCDNNTKHCLAHRTYTPIFIYSLRFIGLFIKDRAFIFEISFYAQPVKDLRPIGESQWYKSLKIELAKIVIRPLGRKSQIGPASISFVCGFVDVIETSLGLSRFVRNTESSELCQSFDGKLTKINSMKIFYKELDIIRTSTEYAYRNGKKTKKGEIAVGLYTVPNPSEKPRREGGMFDNHPWAPINIQEIRRVAEETKKVIDIAYRMSASRLFMEWMLE